MLPVCATSETEGADPECKGPCNKSMNFKDTWSKTNDVSPILTINCDADSKPICKVPNTTGVGLRRETLHTSKHALKCVEHRNKDELPNVMKLATNKLMLNIAKN